MPRIAIMVCDKSPDQSVNELSTGMPLGAMAVSGALRAAGYDAEIFGQSFYPEESWKKNLVDEVVAYHPDIIAISSFSYSWPLCVELAEAIEKRLGAPIIFGGYHVSGVFLHAALSEFPDLWQDFANHPSWVAAVGEGYETIVELVQALTTGSDPLTVKGVAMVRKGNPFISEVRPRLAAGQWPALDRSRYQGFSTDGTGVSTFHTYSVSGVGCRFRCGHCATPFVFPGRVVRSPASVVAEWKSILQSTGNTFWDVFEDFTGDPDWVRAICEEVARQGISEDLHWSSFGNVRDFTADPECGKRILDLMRRSGYTRRMLVGIESANPATLKRLGRPNAFDDVEKFLGMAGEAGIDVWGTVMIGYPWEDETSLRQSLETILHLPLSRLSLVIVMPLIGTDFYRQCRLGGLLDETRSFSDYIGSVPLIQSPVGNLAQIRMEYLSRFYAHRLASNPGEYGENTRHTLMALKKGMDAKR